MAMLVLEITALSRYSQHAMAWSQIVGLTYDEFVRASLIAAIVVTEPSYLTGYNAYHPNIQDNALLQRYIADISNEYTAAFETLVSTDKFPVLREFRILNDRSVVFIYAD